MPAIRSLSPPRLPRKWSSGRRKWPLVPAVPSNAPTPFPLTSLPLVPAQRQQRCPTCLVTPLPSPLPPVLSILPFISFISFIFPIRSVPLHSLSPFLDLCSINPPFLSLLDPIFLSYSINSSSRFFLSLSLFCHHLLSLLSPCSHFLPLSLLPFRSLCNSSSPFLPSIFNPFSSSLPSPP